MLTAERARELLEYHPDTGNLFWLINRRGHARIGAYAGRTMANGYESVGVDGKEYLVHRLAWLITYGEWPKAEIDHINGYPGDNRLKNLREATRAENCQNLGPRSKNKSGFVGVSPTPKGQWAAQLTVAGKLHFLGAFDTPELASAAYREAKAKLHPFNPIPRNSR